MNDPFVEEIRKIRDVRAARFHYDLDAIFHDIKEQEKKSGRTFVSLPPRKVESKRALPPTGAALPPSQTLTATKKSILDEPEAND